MLEIKDIISNVNVYGLDNAIRCAKFPMSTEPNSCNEEVIPRTKVLFGCDMGTGHDNALNGIVVQFDLTLTIKAWTEAQRYHFLDFISSCSTIHRISKFDLDKQYIEWVDDRVIEIMKELQSKYNKNQTQENFYRLIYSNPCGFRLTAGMTTNYRQLKTIYHQRKNH